MPLRPPHPVRRLAARFRTVALVLLAVWAPTPALAQGTAPCRVDGLLTSTGQTLPGVTITVRDAERVLALTSTGVDGRYRLALPAGRYTLSAELTAFAAVTQTLVLDGAPCAQVVDIALSLASRLQSAGATTATASGRATASGTTASGTSDGAGAVVSDGPAVDGAGAAPPPAPDTGAPPQARGSGGARARAPGPEAARAGGRGRGAGFETLTVQRQDTAGAPTDEDEAGDADAARLLPPGFSIEASTEAVAITGETARLDQGALSDRRDAIERGDLRPGIAGQAGAFQGGFGGFGGGRGGFGGGRGGGQERFQGTTTYNVTGSGLTAAPYALRPGATTDREFTRQQFGASFGGRLPLPRVGQNFPTTIQFNYSGSRGRDLRDQYATVASAALREGDFSSLAAPVIDPVTGLPFPDNRIPADRIDPAAVALLRVVPLPTLDGMAQNYQNARTAGNVSDNISLRVTQRFRNPETPVAGGGRRGGGLGGGRGRGTAAGAALPTNVILNGQVQYRRNRADRLDVFPQLDGVTRGTTLAVPIRLDVAKGPLLHGLNVSVTRTTSVTANRFAFTQDVAGDAGIAGAAEDPFTWGVPNLSFASVTSVSDTVPSRRADRRLQVSYTVSRPSTRHTLRFGTDVRQDAVSSQTDANARGTFIFTGLYAGGGVPVSGRTGLDLADFLLGLPQQASVQYGPGLVELRARSFAAFAQDDWRPGGPVTINLGVRYELVQPFTEAAGRMVNLDANPGFTAVAPVLAGGEGAFSGTYPDALVRTDRNNVAPRVGVAWRVNPRTVVRSGYGVSFNNGSYATIARQLVAQPPFAVTATSLGTAEAPLALTSALTAVTPQTTTNNYGIAVDYQLGVIQTWNLDVNRNLGRGWALSTGYTGTRGSHLDMLRAPNRGPDGLRIEGVQPFTWQTSQGTSILHSTTARLQRRQARGIGTRVSYTLAKSIDNASSLSGGGGLVAQDDTNLAAERSLSSFDRRHQLTANVSIDLPFGDGRRWLTQGGAWAALLGDWTVNASFSAQSGTPLTARVLAAVADVARGTNGTLRADATGAPVALDDPTLLHYFNTSAFALPAAGAFGTAGRNTIIGPGSAQLDASFSRNVSLGDRQSVALRLNVTNILNRVQYASVDTTVNSPSFGQVTSVRPMRAATLDLRFRF